MLFVNFQQTKVIILCIAEMQHFLRQKDAVICNVQENRTLKVAKVQKRKLSAPSSNALQNPVSNAISGAVSLSVAPSRAKIASDELV